ncbi:hypothetical protein Hanom_Chr08g00735181 [Helianthus anomalus]
MFHYIRSSLLNGHFVIQNLADLHQFEEKKDAYHKHSTSYLHKSVHYKFVYPGTQYSEKQIRGLAYNQSRSDNGSRGCVCELKRLILLIAMDQVGLFNYKHFLPFFYELLMFYTISYN